MILIYTHHITPRVLYTMDVVFKTVLNIPFQITDNKEEFENNNSPKIAYTKVNEDFDVFIQSDNLLFESDIKIKTIDDAHTYIHARTYTYMHDYIHQ